MNHLSLPLVSSDPKTVAPMGRLSESAVQEAFWRRTSSVMTAREVLQDQRTVGPQRREQRAEKDEYHRGYDIMELP